LGYYFTFSVRIHLRQSFLFGKGSIELSEENMPYFTRRNRPSVWKGLVSGLAGGLAATIVMSQFQNGWEKASKALQAEKNGGSRKSKSKSQSNKQEQKEDATMKAADKVASLAGHPLSLAEEKKASPFVHYGFGTTMGALYGVMQEVAPKPMRRLNPVLAGVGYGGALFFGADEIAVPALGLAPSPKKTPMSQHLYGLASHLVYGVTGEMVRRTVRKYL
jgi:putative membrane protein